MTTEPREHHPGKRIGQGMWMLFWCLLLASLALLFAKREEQLYDPNRQLQSRITGEAREVVLTAGRLGHYTLPGKINNRDVRLLIDTGATEVVIPEALADTLGLKRGLRHRVQTANGEIGVYRTYIDRLQLGPIELYDVSASINPNMDTEILLGMSALRQLEMQQVNNQLILKQPVR